MNILNMILEAQNGGAVKELAKKHNLEPAQATSAIGQLLPALTKGLKGSLASADGLSGLLGALQKGNHQQYIDDPAKVAAPETIQDGNAILGHILGSKDVSRQVAGQAAANTGIDIGILKQMLPSIAAMAMGSMSKQASQPGLNAGAAQASAGAGGGALGGMLSSFLDTDGDGSIADNVMDLAKKFL